MNRVMRWSGVLCGVLTVVGSGGAQARTRPLAEEPRALQAGAPMTQTAAASWTMSAPMPLPRVGNQAALLDSGLVLVMGGWEQFPVGQYPTQSALLYNPYANTWQSTGNVLFRASNYASVKLASGKVLVTGGYDYTYMVSATQVYDPATGGWSYTGSLSLPRQNHKATLLQSGKVLVTGGSVEHPRNGPDPRIEEATFAELYDPETNTWSLAGDVGHGTQGALPVLLYSGEVMLLSGNRVDFYDPATNTWRQGPSMPGFGGSATRLYSGEVLVVGAGSEENDTFLYNPYSGQWRSGPPTNEPHYLRPTATLLYSGEVLIAGGGATERYNPSSNTWTLLPSIPAAYHEASGVLLHTGQVMLTGGSYFHSAASILTP